MYDFHNITIVDLSQTGTLQLVYKITNLIKIIIITLCEMHKRANEQVNAKSIFPKSIFERVSLRYHLVSCIVGILSKSISKTLLVGLPVSENKRRLVYIG